MCVTIAVCVCVTTGITEVEVTHCIGTDQECRIGSFALVIASVIDYPFSGQCEGLQKKKQMYK